MNEENITPQKDEKPKGLSWATIGCLAIIFMIIAIFLVIFYVGTEWANPRQTL